MAPSPVSAPVAAERCRRAGFTLIESALATVIIATGVLSILAAQQAYHRKNDWAQRTATAVLLANELRELTLTLPLHDPISGAAHLGPETGESGIADYDDLDDFAGSVDAQGCGAGISFNPPINALRQTVANLVGWSQRITIDNVLDDNISSTFTQPLGSTHMWRVRVTVMYQSPQGAEPHVITDLVWVVTQP
ncbi:MAG: hypothetical protein IT440_09010 [Phycisphaeraceae bacterium]|nr:hypothetical protein [Phycisphaeraceae bacterium]